eukprot:TRINITY_DN4477_c0_g1_i1.p1 TRINITY_DN4477_c0_g1~~TRINITY_DN4477_c0_g1_i1.p1  ORF type:complete len:149 (+),score=52.13 TRINITY_DN4477_c0_g1_i1:805-1251(+)
MDALDNIDANNSSSSGTPKCSSKAEDSLPLVQYNQDHVSCEDLLDFNHQQQQQHHHNTRRRRRPEDCCDEVRIMKKVLKKDMIQDDAEAFEALHSTAWNVHHAIKLIKVKYLLHKKTSHPTATNQNILEALKSGDWDVVKAVTVLTKM